MPTVDDYKDKIGKQYFIIGHDGEQIKDKVNDEIPFTLIKIKYNTLFLYKERGNWQHQQNFTNERLLVHSLVVTLNR